MVRIRDELWHKPSWLLFFFFKSRLKSAPQRRYSSTNLQSRIAIKFYEDTSPRILHMKHSTATVELRTCYQSQMGKGLWILRKLDVKYMDYSDLKGVFQPHFFSNQVAVCCFGNVFNDACDFCFVFLLVLACCLVFNCRISRMYINWISMRYGGPAIKWRMSNEPMV